MSLQGLHDGQLSVVFEASWLVPQYFLQHTQGQSADGVLGEAEAPTIRPNLLISYLKPRGKSTHVFTFIYFKIISTVCVQLIGNQYPLHKTFTQLHCMIISKNTHTHTHTHTQTHT